MRVVIALGGNALLRRGEPLEADVQQRNVAVAASALAEVAREHAVVVTHGNGPQVGLLALQALAYREVRPYSLDVLGAESEGMIGYFIERELSARLPGREVATLLTQVEVDRNDPAFAAPVKPIGPVYSEAEARQLHDRLGFAIARDGAGFRRVVPSPEPRRIRELAAIRLLVEAGVVVICVGGGGIPVVAAAGGGIVGVEAVIDKDLAASLLAVELGAAALLLLTDVAAVETGWRSPQARKIREASPQALRAESFEAGTMAPKIEAAARFVERTGGFAGIGALAAAAEVLRGAAGTIVRPGTKPIAWY
jgi:carbamate kinase